MTYEKVQSRNAAGGGHRQPGGNAPPAIVLAGRPRSSARRPVSEPELCRYCEDDLIVRSRTLPGRLRRRLERVGAAAEDFNSLIDPGHDADGITQSDNDLFGSERLLHMRIGTPRRRAAWLDVSSS